MVAAMRSPPALAAAGFDVVHGFDAGEIAQRPGMAMLGGRERLGVLVGHTRALWPVFRERMLPDEADPLDRYTERSLEAAFPGARIYYGHRQYDGAFVPLGQLAQAIGVGALAPSRLLIHPVYGPWLALRAVVLLDGEPPVTAPVAQPCQCDARCADALAVALRSTSAEDWLAVRDACRLQAHRYSDDQIAFHYAGLGRALTERIQLAETARGDLRVDEAVSEPDPLR